MTLAVIRKIIPYSHVDGKGNRMVVFLQGCNLRCLYCHNPETIPAADPQSPPNGTFTMTAAELLDHALKYKAFVSGVTFSGGECTLQGDFLIEASSLLRDSGLEVFADTNGYADHESFKSVVDSVDGLLFDIKSFDEEEHMMLTGMSNDVILQNLDYAARKGKIIEVRSVIVPIVLNNYRNVYNTSRLILKYGANIHYKLIAFRNKGVAGSISDVPSPTKDQMEELRRTAVSLGLPNVSVI